MAEISIDRLKEVKINAMRQVSRLRSVPLGQRSLTESLEEWEERLRMATDHLSARLVNDAVERMTLNERDRFFCYWIARAYESGNREGWEEGPSVDETMSGLLRVLSNLGFAPPNSPFVELVRSQNIGTVAPPPIEAKYAIVEHGGKVPPVPFDYEEEL